MLRHALVLAPLLAGLITAPVFAQEAALLQLGLDALKQGRYADAAKVLEQHTRLQPEDLKALQALSEAYLQLNQPELAEVTLNAAHTLERSDAQTHLLRGRLRLSQKDFQRARSEFRTVEYLKQTNGELWYYLALTYQGLGDLDNARLALNEGLRDKNTLPDTSARLLLLQGEFDPAKASESLDLALQIQNLSPALLAELQQRNVDYLVQNNKVGMLIQQQIPLLKTALENKDTETARRMLREIEVWLGKSNKPDQDRLVYRKQLEQLYDQMPNQPLLRQQLVQTYERQRLYEDLLVFYQLEFQANAASWSEQEIGAGFHRMADVYLKQGFVELAHKNYRLAADKNPRDFVAFKRLGVLHLAYDDAGEAVKIFQRVMQEDPLDRENILFLALAQAYRRDDNQAKTLLQQIPQDVRPDLRLKIDSVFLMEGSRTPEKTLWKLMIPDETILSSR